MHDASLRADYEALRNDLEQANELASDFQRELAAKSNEVAHVKSLSEKTQRDLEQLQATVVTLRDERQRFLNEATRTGALDRRLAVITADRDRLHAEVEVLQQSNGGSGEETARRLREQEAQIAQLGSEIESLQQRLAFASRPAPAAAAATAAVPTGSTISPEIKAVANRMGRAFDELMHLIESSAEAPRGKRGGGGTKPVKYEKIEVPEEQDDSLDISFGA